MKHYYIFHLNVVMKYVLIVIVLLINVFIDVVNYLDNTFFNLLKASLLCDILFLILSSNSAYDFPL